MSSLNSIINSEAQTISLEEAILNKENGVDLNYAGYQVDNPKSAIELFNKDANDNRICMWLASKKGDYGRNALNKGGVIYNLLGKLKNDTNLSQQEILIREKFNEDFSGDLNLMNISLKKDKLYKKLTITMIYNDVLTNKVSVLSQEVSL